VNGAPNVGVGMGGAIWDGRWMGGAAGGWAAQQDGGGHGVAAAGCYAT